MITTGQRYPLSTSVKYFQPFLARSRQSQCDLYAACFRARHFGNDCVDTAFSRRKSDLKFPFPNSSPQGQRWSEKTVLKVPFRDPKNRTSRAAPHQEPRQPALETPERLRGERRNMRKGPPPTSGARAAALPPRGNHVAPSFPSLAGWARATAGEARGSSR